ncbi:MAG TPA: FtsX-like permease family protein [Pricia sp.]|nr:FtsX-like permease family protein [Pricia sp.]
MMLDKDLGFTSENTITTKLFPDVSVPIELMGQPSEQDKNDPQKTQQRSEKIEAYENLKAKQNGMYEFVKNELRTNPSIAGFSQGNSPLQVYRMPWKLKNEIFEFLNINTLTVSPGHKGIFDYKLIEGRFFDDVRDKAYSTKIVINEAAKKYWGINDISDSRILNKYWGGDEDHDGYWNEEPVGYEILGVVKDFNYERLSLKPEPLVMVYLDRKQQDDFLIQFEKGATVAGLASVEKMFHQANPNEVFTYSFLTDEIGEMYEKEKQLSILYMVFTALALIISSIGLFTIALYDTRRRVKEIGIRKVNGAKTHEVLVMLNKDFSKFVGLAFALACPITYLLMDKWLENFAYRTDMSWWVFLLSGAFTLLIALLTVSWQSYRAANANPVNSLRTE